MNSSRRFLNGKLEQESPAAPAEAWRQSPLLRTAQFRMAAEDATIRSESVFYREGSVSAKTFLHPGQTSEGELTWISDRPHPKLIVIPTWMSDCTHPKLIVIPNPSDEGGRERDLRKRVQLLGRGRGQTDRIFGTAEPVLLFRVHAAAHVSYGPSPARFACGFGMTSQGELTWIFDRPPKS